MNKYQEQYPASGYEVYELGTDVVVMCPMHGAFQLSATNFLYHRGCALCRGVHQRAYPLQSTRTWASNPVFIDEGGLVSREPSNPIYGVGYSDKRIADVVYKLVSALTPHELDLAKKIMLAASSFQFKPHHRTRCRRFRGNTVSLNPAGDMYKVLPPDSIVNASKVVAFFPSRITAEIVAHIVSNIGENPGFVTDKEFTEVERILRLIDYLPYRMRR